MKVTILVSFLMLFTAGCSSKTSDSGGGNEGGVPAEETGPTPSPTPESIPTPSPTPPLFAGMPKPLNNFFPTMADLGIDETSFKTTLQTSAQSNCPPWSLDCSGPVGYMSSLSIMSPGTIFDGNMMGISGFYCRAKVLSELFGKNEFVTQEMSEEKQYKIDPSGIRFKWSAGWGVQIIQLTYTGGTFILKSTMSTGQSTLSTLDSAGIYKYNGLYAGKYYDNGKILRAHTMMSGFNSDFSNFLFGRYAKLSSCPEEANFDSCIYPVEGMFSKFVTNLEPTIPAGLYTKSLSKSGSITPVTISSSEALPYSTMNEISDVFCGSSASGLHADFSLCSNGKLAFFDIFGLNALTDPLADHNLPSRIYSDNTERDIHIGTLDVTDMAAGLSPERDSENNLVNENSLAIRDDINRCIFGY